MSIEVMAAVWRDEELDQAETLTMLALADWANDHGRCWPSLPQLMKKTRLSERGLREIIRRLVDKGRLDKTDIAGKGTKYVVRPRHYVPPQHDVPPAPDAGTPARRAANTSIHTNSSGAKAPSRSRAKPKRGFEAGIQEYGTDSTKAEHGFRVLCVNWAVLELKWSTPDAGIEFDRFKDNAMSRDRQYSDWLAAWRNWCRSEFCKVQPKGDGAALRELAKGPFRG